MISKLLRYSIFFFLFVITASAALFYLPATQVYLSAQAEKAIAKLTDGKVVVKELSFSSPISFTAKKVLLENPGKTEAQVDDFFVLVNPWSLLTNKWELKAVYASSLKISLPKSGSRNATPVVALLSISINNFSLEKLSVYQDDQLILPYTPSFKGKLAIDAEAKTLCAELNVKIPELSSSYGSLSLFSSLSEKNPSTVLTLKDRGIGKNWTPYFKNSKLELVFDRSIQEFTVNADSLSATLLVNSELNTPLLSGLCTGRANLSIAQNNVFSLQQIQVETPVGQMEGNLSFSLENFKENSFTFLADSKALESVLKTPVATPTTLTFSLQGPLFSPQLIFSGIVEEVAWEGVCLKKTTFDGKAAFQKHLLLHISLLSHASDALWSLQSKLLWDYDNLLTIYPSSLSSKNESIHMQGVWDRQSALFEGTISAKAQQLPPFLSKYFSLAKTTPIEIESKWFVENMTQSNKAIIKMDQANLEQLVVEDLAVTASLQNITHTPKGSIDIEAKSIRYDEYQGSSLALHFHSQDGNKWEYSLETSTQLDHVYSSGFLLFSPDELKLHCKELSMSLQQSSIELLEECSFVYSSNSYILNPVQMAIEKGTLWLAASLEPEAVNISVKLEHFPLKFLPTEELTDHSLEGLVDVKAHIMGHPNSPTGSIDVSFSQLMAVDEQDMQIPPLNGALSAKILTQEIEVEGNLSTKESSPIKITTKIPGSIRFTSPYLFVDRNAPFSLDFEASGEISPVLELFFTDTSSLTGSGTMNISVRGTLHTPKISGTASLVDGVFENDSLGTYIQNIQATVQGEGRRLELLSFQATDGDRGIIQGDGVISLLPDEGFPFELNMQLEKASLIRADYVNSAFSGSLQLFGTSKQMNLTGHLEAIDAEVRIPQKIPEVNETVEIRYVNQDPDKLSPTTYDSKPYMESPVTLNVTLSAPKKFVIRSQDLRSEWVGKVDILGDLTNPAVRGEVNLVQGQYYLNGNLYDINRGRLSFAGDFQDKSNVYITASREIENYLVEIILKGKLMDPSLVLRSNPPLSKEQLLSLILFGQVSESFSTRQAEQIEQSLSNLSSDPDKVNTLARIQKGLGIDNIQFMRSESGIGGETAIQLGKYLTRDVYLSVNRALSDEIHRFALEAKITKNLRARIGATTDAEGEVSLYWHIDY